MIPAATAPVMSDRRTAIVGTLAVTLGPLSLSLYTPALPTLVEAFHTTPSALKLTLTVFFCGYAFAQLLSGPLSDAFGRRAVALSFFAAYMVGSLMAAGAATIDWLLAGRMLQGVGVAAGLVVGRAIVRDQFTGQQSARIMSLIGLMLAIVPAVSPSLGGLMLATVGWHAIFLAMTLYGGVVLAVFAFGVRETNAHRHRGHAHPGRVLRNYATLLANRTFMSASLAAGLSLGGMYALSAILPFVLIDTVGLTPTQFGLAMLLQTGGYTAGAAVANRLLRRVDAQRLVPVGLALVLATGLWYAVGLRLLPPSLLTVMVPLMAWTFGIGLLLPGTTSEALAGFPAMAGAASALLGFLQIGSGFAGSAAAALLFSDPLAALTTVMPAMAAIAVVARTLRPRPSSTTAALEHAPE